MPAGFEQAEGEERTLVHAEALNVAGVMAYFQSDYRDARVCSEESLAITLHAGDLVVVTPAMLEGQCGTVRWVVGNEAGIEFATPLYGPVVEHLHRHFRTFLSKGPVQSSPAAQLAA